MEIVREGICNDRPRARKSGRLGVCGDGEGTLLSSFDTVSLKLGEGASARADTDVSEMAFLLGVR